MRRSDFKILLFGCMISASIYFNSCKSKPKDTDNTVTAVDTVTATNASPAPVEVAPDNALTIGAKDATKDFPGVKADVSNGEITLTGEIQRSKLPNLIMALNSLKPKKINNQLTIK